MRYIHKRTHLKMSHVSVNELTRRTWISILKINRAAFQHVQLQLRGIFHNLFYSIQFFVEQRFFFCFFFPAIFPLGSYFIFAPASINNTFALLQQFCIL